MAVCATPGCPELVQRGHCPTHRPGDPRNRTGDAHNQRRWKTKAATYRKHHPHCVACGAPSEHADHVIPRQVLVAAGVHDPDADQWLQPLCHRHHSSKTQLVDVPILRRLPHCANPQALGQTAHDQAVAWLARIQAAAVANTPGG